MVTKDDIIARQAKQIAGLIDRVAGEQQALLLGALGIAVGWRRRKA
jgi:hypothetical protein